MTKKTTLLLLSFIAFISNVSLAQDNAIEQTFHESGKINVVVAVVMVIFIGIIFYLIKLEKKISKLEKNSDK
ncbi:MAG: CcmD family protein [Flavobacteriales bacterium]|jgi:CcmD family protein|tara:strand:+ start:1714 stop:1929 length:216 start_codon:yes stop_codon:yes gene_type:complete